MVALIAAKIASDLARQGINIITERIAKKKAAEAVVKAATFLFPMGYEDNQPIDPFQKIITAGIVVGVEILICRAINILIS